MSGAAEEELRELARLLEASDAPMSPAAYPLLGDEQVRAELAVRLRAAGRQLVEVRAPGQGGAIEGYVTSWDDEIAEAILAAGRQPLPVIDQAVLALVLLQSVIIPQAAGMASPHGFRAGLPVNALALRQPGPDGQGIDVADIDDALKRLRSRGIITRDNRPGPAFLRLSSVQQARLWQNLLRFARPAFGGHTPPAQETTA
ncbi:hypothetical protein [Longispora albida]|uniref:hypothetical protein n=1 Tax=Longispora albida TaxID=203523 RepID=UPI0003826346|nr:hypothetical protein [Longispora albida]